MAISPVRLNHAVLFVADLERSLRFYTDVFGMEVVAREPRADAAFLRLPRSGNHHDLGLFGVGSSDGTRQRGGIGLYHLAWQLDTIDELAAARRVLFDAGAYTGESDHGATKSVYGADPDGNEFEIMWMLPRDEWGPYENSAPIERLDLDAEVRRWTGVRTAGASRPGSVRGLIVMDRRPCRTHPSASVVAGAGRARHVPVEVDAGDAKREARHRADDREHGVVGAGLGGEDHDGGTGECRDRVQPRAEHDGYLPQQDVTQHTPPTPVMTPRTTALRGPMRWSIAVLAPVTQKRASPPASRTRIGRSSFVSAAWATNVTRPAHPATAM